MTFQLLGFGFNGFGQLCHPSEHGGTNEAQFTSVGVKKDKGDTTMVCQPRKLMSFPSKPLIHFSCAWDAMHISVQCSGSSCSLSTGRWSEVMQTANPFVVEGGRGSRQGEILRVVEVKDTILLQTSSRLLVGKATCSSPQLQESSLPQDQSLQFIPLSDGKLFAATLDCGEVYQCVIPTPTSELTLGPVIAGLKSPITHISCGTDHVLMLSNSGAVYSFGLGSRGQLGHGDILPRKEPHLIEALAGVAMKYTASGNWHSMTLSEYGDVYSWGWNDHGQLGHSHRSSSEVTKTVPLPTLVDIEVASGSECEWNCISISCGSRHSAAVADTGVLYTWGWNGYGQLGRRPLGGAVCPSPSPVDLGEVVAESVHCGHWNTVVMCKQSSQ